MTMTNTQPTAQNAIAAAVRLGAGTVALGGSYTGGSSAVVSVEVLNSTLVGAPIISAQSFSGVGSGTMSSVAATSAVAAQKITVELIDVGTRTRKAWLPLYGVFLRARTAGTGGNAITLTVDQTGVTRTATQFALIDGITNGTNEYAGAQWDFGAPILQEDGTIPPTAPRISFGNDSQIYRQYKTYSEGRFIYSFSPIPRADYAAGTKVYNVAGDRTVTIADGIAPDDVYTGIDSLYSILSAIKNDITGLAEVDGPVLNDLAPGGMGMQEFDVQTVSYAASILGEGTPFVKLADIQYLAAVSAPTETVVIECVRADRSGQEIWSVRGDVSGALTNAFTGQIYAGSICEFLIPFQSSTAGPPLGDITARPTWKTRSNGDPCFHFYRPILGIAASPKTVVYEYQKRPTPNACCDNVTIKPGPSFTCLGIDPPEEPMALSAELIDFKAAKSAQVAEWARLLVSLQRSPPFPGGATPTVPTISEDAVDAVRQAKTLLLKALDECVIDGAYLTPTVWVLSTVVAKYAMRAPTTANGYLYQATTGGTTSGTQPTWPTTVGDTVTDGSVVWENVGRTVQDAFESAFTQVKTEFAQINALGEFGREWIATTVYGVGAIARPITANGHWYQAEAGGTSGGTEPTWPTSGGIVVDGTVTWRDAGAYWTASQATKKGESKSVPGVGLFLASVGGTTDATIPVFSRLIDARYWDASGLELPRTVTDNTVTWTLVARAIVNGWEAFVTGDEATTAINRAKIAAWIDSLTDVVGPIYAAARIANFNSSSGPSSDCWTDKPKETHWWVCTSEQFSYLPVFNNTGYHSVALRYDSAGVAYYEETKEFYFAFQVCADQLIVGDKITVTIGALSNGLMTYQVGDRISVDVIKSSPLAFENGMTGTDALTWGVLGTVDGPFASYVLNLITPNAYSDGGLSFEITEGSVPFKLGDIYSFWAEGGQFRWRLDSGSWTTAQIAPSVSISSGLTLSFNTGEAPSFITPDAFSLAALASSGIDQARTPDDAACAWVASTNIDLTTAAAVRFVGLLEHTIPQAATVRLQGSNDNFSTTPLNDVLVWRSGNMSWIAATATANYDKYRLAITGGSGSIGWIYAGTPDEPLIETGRLELGLLSKRVRLPTSRQRRGLGMEISHSALGQTAVDSLIDSLAHATEFDGGAIGLLPNDLEPAELTLARIRGDEIDVTDIPQYSFQPRDNSLRFQTVKLVFDPA